MISFRIDGDKLFKKFKAIWTKIEDLKHIELKPVPVYGDRYVITKIRTYDDIVYTNFPALNVPEDNKDNESL